MDFSNVYWFVGGAFAVSGILCLIAYRHKALFRKYNRINAQSEAMFTYRRYVLDPRVEVSAAGRLTDEERHDLSYDIGDWLDTVEDLQDKRDALWRRL